MLEWERGDLAMAHTTFDRLKFGFRFRNSFDAIPPITLPFIGTFDLGTLIIGLCGGMAYAALDYYHAGVDSPSADAPDRLRPEELRYLYRRQGDSMGLMVLNRIFQWMLRSDRDLLEVTITKELPTLMARLDSGEPAVLLLLRAQGMDNPTRNHQVVAAGYDLDPLERTVTILLYDPNHPDHEPTIRLPYEFDENGMLVQSERQDDPLRAFFVMPYRRCSDLP